jgi:large subunit ribosomal protein L25
MPSDRTTLKVAPREEFGSRTSRRLRRDGLVPGVVYGEGGEARAFQVGEREARAVIDEGHALFDVEIEGSGSVPVVVKELQLHPVRSDLVHIDFHEVRLDTKIEADVSIELEGADNAPGVKAGGVLEHVTREVTVSALPTAIPEGLTADVSAMEIGDTLTLDTIDLPADVEFTVEDLEEVTIVTLSPPRVEEEPVVAEDPELIGEEGEEGEEGAEPADGEGEGGDESSGDSEASGGE